MTSLASDLDSATMQCNRLLDYDQPKPRALDAANIASPMEGCKQMSNFILGNTYALVGYLKHGLHAALMASPV